jgi:NAD(P)-dependent dehydrogenase (short-subunit alcohol dehydrogenase family)
VIVNIGTVGSLLASPKELPYACAKAGLNALTVGLAEAFAPTVRVNAILPGAFDTDVTRAWTDEMRSGNYVPWVALGNRARSSAPHCIWRAKQPATPPVRRYASTGV